MPPPSGGKLKAKSRGVPKLPRYHLPLDRPPGPDPPGPTLIAFAPPPRNAPRPPPPRPPRGPPRLGAPRRRARARDGGGPGGGARKDRGGGLKPRVDPLGGLGPGHGEGPGGPPPRPSRQSARGGGA